MRIYFVKYCEENIKLLKEEAMNQSTKTDTKNIAKRLRAAL